MTLDELTTRHGYTVAVNLTIPWRLSIPNGELVLLDFQLDGHPPDYAVCEVDTAGSVVQLDSGFGHGAAGWKHANNWMSERLSELRLFRPEGIAE